MIQTEYKRSGLKAVTWRVIATFTTMSLVLIYTGKIDLTLSIGGLDIILKMGLYFFHERVWDRIAFGKTFTLDASVDYGIKFLHNIEN